MGSYLSAWHRFIPSPHALDASNCWYSHNSMPTTLPNNMYSRMRLLPRFIDMQTNFMESEIRMTLEKLQNATLPATRNAVTDTHFCVPTVYLMGISKCGTTLLYSYIKSHPQMAQPHNKEGQFWREFVQTPEPHLREFQILLYLHHFQTASSKIQQYPKMFTLDASASTIFATSNPLQEVEKDICTVPLMLHLTLPKAKFLVIMRDPVDRLWSDFWYFCSREHWRNRKVYDVPEGVLSVAAEMFHNFTVTAILEFTHCINSGHTHFHCTALAGSYPGKEGSCERVRLGLSIYYIHLVKWFSVFPHKLILPVKFENLVSEPSKTMDKVWPFLEVPARNVTPIKKRLNANEWIVSSEYSENFKMWPETRALLREFFEPYNLALAELLQDKEYLWT